MYNHNNSKSGKCQEVRYVDGGIMKTKRGLCKGNIKGVKEVPIRKVKTLNDCVPFVKDICEIVLEEELLDIFVKHGISEEVITLLAHGLGEYATGERLSKLEHISKMYDILKTKNKYICNNCNGGYTFEYEVHSDIDDNVDKHGYQLDSQEDLQYIKSDVEMDIVIPYEINTNDEIVSFDVSINLFKCPIYIKSDGLNIGYPNVQSDEKNKFILGFDSEKSSGNVTAYLEDDFLVITSFDVTLGTYSPDNITLTFDPQDNMTLDIPLQVDA
ncbi:MAG: hypothetical protein COA94_02155 [Rickettsiales bacterium]|nr:MAG: hypothetical protein COA94_02155 [Rickettsiales bacterium]